MSVADDLKGRVNRDQLRDLKGKAGRVASRGADVAKGAHGKAVATVTQKDNWDSVERYLAQVVEVLAAQEAEIGDLRHQVAGLTARINAQ